MLESTVRTALRSIALVTMLVGVILVGMAIVAYVATRGMHMTPDLLAYQPLSSAVVLVAGALLYMQSSMLARMIVQ
jgi:hypothetical protein